MLTRLTLVLALSLLLAGPAEAQENQIPTTIPEMWNAWCARCHGIDGTGKVAVRTVTIEPLDLTDCKVAMTEADTDWELVIAKGGPAAGLSSQMPAFGDVLTPDQISGFVKYAKGFCKETGWPDGNLNLPRPLFAEKAFPEDEFIIAPVSSHRKGEPAAFSMAAILERRFGKRAQFEALLPLESADPGAGRSTGVGDLELGIKYVLTPRASNHLVSAGFDVHLPTGSDEKGLGEGVTIFEPYVATATAIGTQTYLQTQLKLEFPKHEPWRDRATVYNIYLGYDAKLIPTTFTFGVELNGENEELALTPQLRKGLSRTGALAAAIGVRIPLNKRQEQGVTWVGYLLWEYLEPVFSRR